jgi:WD40 repeat protein
MNENALVVQDKAASFAVAFEQARNDILQKFAPMRHTVHGVGIGHTNVVNAGAFTPDGKGLLTASWDGTAILWDIQSGLPVRRFVGHEGDSRGKDLCHGR